MMHPSSHRRAASQMGFTLTELVVVVSLGVLMIFALQQALIGQRRYYAAQKAVTQRHETLRFASAVLGSALREANIPGGDVDILGPGRVRVRMPVGLAFVCGADASGQRVGAVGLEGQWTAGIGDSVLVQLAAGWSAEAINVLSGPVNQVACVQLGGSVLQLGRRVPDVVAGSPARAFRSVVFEIATGGTDYWLYRTDGAQRDLLLGPLDGVAGFQVWFADALGGPLPGPLGAERVGVRVIATAQNPPIAVSNRRDTLVMTFTGRNR